MASPETQMAGSLRRIEAIAQAAAGVREVKQVAGRTTGDQTINHETVAGYKKLIISVYKLTIKPEEPATGDAKPAPKAGKATLSIAVKIPLPGGEDVYQLTNATIIKSGVTDLDLEICPNKFDLVIEVEGEAEYAIYGL